MKTLVILVNVLASLALWPALYLAMFSPMLFDSGATQRTWTLFYTVVAIPVSIVITQVVSWVLFAKGLYTVALWVSLVPLLFVALLAVLFLMSSSLT